MARENVSAEIARLVGEQAINVVALARGWPSFYDVKTSSGIIPVSAHVTIASPHARRPHEWRIQNPADKTPITAPSGSLPIMIGLDTSGPSPILIAIDGHSRLNRASRFSILFNHSISNEARARGWSEYEAGNGQKVYAFQPRLFPTLVEMLAVGVDVAPRYVADAAAASGLLSLDDDQSADRARRIASVYVRDAKFSKIVREAYGHRCAMCGVKLGLVTGAHIYPVSAPGSPDSVWNGLALCHNHHSAFDAFKIWVEPDFSLRFNPEFVAEAEGHDESERFLQNTRDSLLLPQNRNDRPRGQMFDNRYSFYAERYAWAR